jgi:hypothetical protein
VSDSSFPRIFPTAQELLLRAAAALHALAATRGDRVSGVAILARHLEADAARPALTWGEASLVEHEMCSTLLACVDHAAADAMHTARFGAEDVPADAGALPCDSDWTEADALAVRP